MGKSIFMIGAPCAFGCDYNATRLCSGKNNIVSGSRLAFRSLTKPGHLNIIMLMFIAKHICLL